MNWSDIEVGDLITWTFPYGGHGATSLIVRREFEDPYVVLHILSESGVFQESHMHFAPVRGLQVIPAREDG